MGSSVTDTCTEVLRSRVGANGMHLCGMHPRPLLSTRPQVTAMLTSEGLCVAPACHSTQGLRRLICCLCR